jgi:hypothetical protein
MWDSNGLNKPPEAPSRPVCLFNAWSPQDIPGVLVSGCKPGNPQAR